MKKRQCGIMTKSAIDAELRKIYKERQSWPVINKQLNYEIPSNEIRRRELVLYAQYLLNKIENAKGERNRQIASFNCELFKLIRKYLRTK